MEIQPWRQRVLIVSLDSEFVSLVRQAFHQESELAVAPTAITAMEALMDGTWSVVIIDASSIDFVSEYAGSKDIPSFEVSDYANKMFPGASVIIAVDKSKIPSRYFAKRAGAVLVMDRAKISLDLMIFVIRVLRRRTFRTVIRSDLPIGQALAVDLFHYLPMNRRYSVFLHAGDLYTEARDVKLEKAHIRHLYVRTNDMTQLFQSLKETGGGTFSQQLADLRRRYRQWIISLFDCSTDGDDEIGRESFRDGMSIVRGFSKLTGQYKNPRVCLDDLPYPRWSTIAHGMNTVQYALVFGEICGLKNLEEIGFASLIHNLGEATLNQTMFQNEQRNFNPTESKEYESHVQQAVELIDRKRLPVDALIRDTILHHHENYDGSGYPDHLAGDRVSLSTSLLSIADTYDFYHTARPGKPASSPAQAWADLKAGVKWATRFRPELIADLDTFFSRS